jgi:hypothetical protein
MGRPSLDSIQSEQDWLTCSVPEPMIAFLGEQGSLRRWRLFACNCCLRILPLLTDERSVRAVIVAERLADGKESAENAMVALEEAREAEILAWQQRMSAQCLAATAARRCLETPRRTYETTALAARGGQIAERLAQCDLLRDLFGNPFRPVVFEPSWRTPLILQMAQEIYEQENFADLPILADALEDVGCTLTGLLDHCRESALHARGCWALDRILGRE